MLVAMENEVDLLVCHCQNKIVSSLTCLALVVVRSRSLVTLFFDRDVGLARSGAAGNGKSSRCIFLSDLVALFFNRDV